MQSMRGVLFNREDKTSTSSSEEEREGGGEEGWKEAQNLDTKICKFSTPSVALLNSRIFEQTILTPSKEDSNNDLHRQNLSCLSLSL